MNHPDFAEAAARVQAELQASIQTGSEVTTRTLQNQMLVPVAISHFLPIGVKGVFLAVMIFWMVSTDTTYMHSWGSIFIQDVVMPLRKKPLSEKAHLILLRLSIVGVAVFAFFFSLFYGQTTYILMFFALTGALYLGGAGAVIIGGLYWDRGTTAGAWGAMIVGLVFALTGWFFTHYWAELVYPFLSTQHPALLEAFKNGLEGLGRALPIANWSVGPTKFPITGQEILFLTILAAVGAYIIISILTSRERFNLDRMLHRGEYARKDEALSTLSVADEKKRGILQKILGFNENYTKGDRILAWSVFWWTMVNFAIFVVVAFWNMIFGIWSAKTWFLYWKYYTVGLTIVVASITTVWFTIGGIVDLRALFKRLKTLQVNKADDGSVIGHMNADDFLAMQSKEAARPDSAPPVEHPKS
jgi:SSS family solute:Na+ symporter